MMESSEQCSEDYAGEDTPLNEDDDQANAEVLGYLDKKNAALLLNSHRIELDGKRLILTQENGEEIVIMLNSEQEPQSISENSNNIHTLTMQCGLNNLGAINSEGIQVIERNDGLHNIDKNGTLFIEKTHEPALVDSDNNHYSSEASGYHGQEEDTTEMVFIPTTSQVISLSNNTGFLHFSGVIQPTAVTSKLHRKEEIECSKKISEGSVTVSQTHADSYSSEVEDVGVSALNKDNNNSLHDEHMAAEIETSSPTVEESSSMLSMPPQEIDHAVSVIDLTTSTLVHNQDWRIKNIQGQAEEMGQPDIKLPAVSTNVTYFECSNLKESLDSELFSKSPFIDESSNHSDLKCGADSSNKDGNANCETSASVEETVYKETNESIHFSPQLPSSENIVDVYDSKREDSINCNNNDSNTSVVLDLSHNLDNKIFYPSSKNCKNEMDFTNSEEACAEIQTCTERTFLPLGDNSESKSFFSDNSQSKDCNLHTLKKMKSVSPSKIKKVIDEYDFENSSSNLDQELSHNSSLDRQPSDLVNSDDTSAEVDATKVSQSANSYLEDVTGNVTFQGVLTPFADITKLDENLADGKNSETVIDNSQYSFDQGPQHKEEHSSSKMLKSTNVKFFKDKQNSVFREVNHTDEDKTSDENILTVKNSVNIDNKSKEIDSISDEITVKTPLRTYVRKKRTFDSGVNIELFSLDDLSDNEPYPSPKFFCVDNEKEQIMIDEYSLTDEDGYVNLIPSIVKNRIKAKCTPPVDEKTITLSPQSSDNLELILDPVMDAEDSVSTCCGVNIDNKSKENVSVFSDVASYYETSVKPPQRTYIRKKKTFDSGRKIELFSLDDLSDNEPYPTPKLLCVDSEKEQIMIDEDNLADEDGYVNLMPSIIKNGNKAKCIPPVDERTITLSPQSSDSLEIIPDPAMDAEDSLNFFRGTYLMETPFKLTDTEKTEGDAPEASLRDVSKVKPPRSSFEKRVQTPWYEKISAKIDSYETGRERVIKSSYKMRNASSDKRKIKKTVKTHIEKSLRNYENFNHTPIPMAHHQKGQQIRDDKKNESILYSSFSSSLEKIKICRIKFLNDNSTDKNNSSAIDELSTPSTSTEKLKNFQYTCSNCNFVSSKVNNLITHLKYCVFKPMASLIDYQILDLERRQRRRGRSSESFSSDMETSSSQNFSDASVIHDEFITSHPTISEALHMASDGMPNTSLSMFTKPHYH